MGWVKFIDIIHKIAVRYCSNEVLEIAKNSQSILVTIPNLLRVVFVFESKVKRNSLDLQPQ